MYLTKIASAVSFVEIQKLLPYTLVVRQRVQALRKRSGRRTEHARRARLAASLSGGRARGDTADYLCPPFA